MPLRTSSVGLDLTPEQQFELLARGTEEILPEGGLLERLRLRAREGKPLRVKQGFDPTAPDLHLGHCVGLRKLRQFQDLGHQIVLIVGDYTGMVGDPSGLSKTRPRLAETEVEAQRAYVPRTVLPRARSVARAAPASRRGPPQRRVVFAHVVRRRHAPRVKYTLARLLERDDFAKRFAARQPISIHELFYPLMQGYDSVAIRADVELGGDGAEVQPARGPRAAGGARAAAAGHLHSAAAHRPRRRAADEQDLGNYIGVTDTPSDMYGKVHEPARSRDGFVLAARDGRVAEELREIAAALADPSINPMTIKKRLARRIVGMYHGARRGREGRARLRGAVLGVACPMTFPSSRATRSEGDASGAEGSDGRGRRRGDRDSESRSAARRLIDQKAMRVDGGIVEALGPIHRPRFRARDQGRPPDAPVPAQCGLNLTGR